MTTYLGKSCSIGLPRVSFANYEIYVFSYFPFGFEGRMWDLIVSVPDHCLSFYFINLIEWTFKVDLILQITKDRLSSLLETQNDIDVGLVKTCVKP